MTPILLFTRDLNLAYRRGGGALAAAGFCLVAFCVFAFALGPEALRANAYAVLAVAVFLACLLALPGLFSRDAEDGTLEQYLLSPVPLEALVAAKLAAFWCAFALPLLALTPLLAVMAGMNGAETLALFYTLLLTTPALAAIGGLGAALTLGVRGAGFTQALVVLPLYLPPLIFAASGEGSARLLLAAMSLGAFPLACVVGAMLLRLGYE